MKKIKTVLGPLFPCAFFFALNLVILSASRLGLAIWQHERVAAADGWGKLFLQGVRMDISLLCWFLPIFALLSIFLIWENRVGDIFKRVLCVIFTVATVFFIFMELSTPSFIETYDFRPNRIFVEYLVHPKEIFSMLIAGHLFALVATPIATGLLGFGVWKLFVPAMRGVVATRWQYRPLILVPVAALLFLGARSTLGHRPINPSMVAFSSDSMVNSLVLNSTYSLGFAISQMRNEADAGKIYGKMPAEEIVARIKGTRGQGANDYISQKLPTLFKFNATYEGKPRNIVIILEESLGAQFIGTLGGKNLSPNFDKLAEEGWLFENLYCTGTRPVRGIEAVIAGFTPTPASAVVKLQKSQSNFFTIAEFLKKHGYKNSFIYGGEKHFDNMASFFYGNGFDLIIDEKDFDTFKYKTTWGASDEDLFDMAHKKFTEFSTSGTPFMSLVFTSSNHDPFDVPLDKIEELDANQFTRNNAAQYADYALGHFFKLAKKSNYWDNTIFLIIADHDSRVAGASLVPMNNFHIPALILGKNIKPKRDKRLVSQIDMPPTLLSLAGTDGASPMIGYDLTKPENPNRALMQFNDIFCYRRGNEVVLLAPKAEPRGFLYDEKTGTLTPTKTVSEDLKKLALAKVLWGSLAYKEGLHADD